MDGDLEPQSESVSADFLKEDVEHTQRQVCGQNNFKKLWGYRAPSCTAWQKHRKKHSMKKKRIIAQVSNLKGRY